MGSTIAKLESRGLAHPPAWLSTNTHYETIMGSMSYGVSSDSSDIDLYGFVIPPKDLVFPHLAGEIPGFGRQIKRFEQYQQHHIQDEDALSGKGRVWDAQVYSIVKYFDLCMNNNPNMIDSLFTPQTCVLHCTQVGNLVREKRKMFLHKGSWHTFKGYSYSQLHKINSKEPQGKRRETVEKFGWDVKFGYHCVRLLNEVEQILTEGDLDLQRNNDQLKAIRRGEWTKEQLVEYFNFKEKDLESLYTSSKLPWGPPENEIKALLLNCLEMHYGSLEKCVATGVNIGQIVRELEESVTKLRKMI
jgi:uncharacterized protein